MPPIWKAGASRAAFSPDEICGAVAQVRETAYVIRNARGAVGVAIGGEMAEANGSRARDESCSLIGVLPPLYPEWLGDRTFSELHRVRFPYVVGEMATGIATTEMVIAAARNGLLGFYGSAGLTPERVERAIDEIEAALAPDQLSWGANLIHSPNEPAMEDAMVDLFLRRGVARVSASAFMALSPAIVRYAASGLQIDSAGEIYRSRYVFAKVSRPEVAAHFMAPPPAEVLSLLLSRRQITPAEARLAARIPVAEDITAEADSGGHTDNRPLTALLPVISSLRDRLAAEHRFTRPIRIGAAGGLGTPSAVAAAFGLGAAYVLTGSINQSACEAGTSAAVKQMLARADLADVVMAPAADMFELGVKVQVLKRGTLFAVRAAQLYQIYAEHAGLDALPPAVTTWLEKEIFRAPLSEIWAKCVQFWSQRDPRQLERAQAHPKHEMALVFRWYLGNGSRWAITGDPERTMDYQIWCGPSMGAFNTWVRGTFLAEPAARTVAQIAFSLLEGAAIVTRAQQLRTFGAPVPARAFDYRPRPLS